MMNWLDLAFLGICLFSLQIGFQKGFIKQTAIFISILLGIILAGRLHLPLAKSKTFLVIANNYNESAALVTAYVGIFLLTICLFQVFTFLMRRGIQDGTLGHIDNLFGALFSVAKAYIILAVISLSIFSFLPGNNICRHFSESYAAPKIVSSFRTIIEGIPEQYRNQINSFMAQQKMVKTSFKNFCYATPPDDVNSIPVWKPENQK